MSVSDQIIAVINDLCEKLGIAIDWSAENILPKVEELCNKYISYEIWTSVAWMALWVFIFLTCFIIGRGMHKAELKKDEIDRWDFDNSVSSVLVMVFYILAAVTGFIALCVVGTQIFDIIEAKVFPEKTIYEFVSSKLESLNSR